MYVVLWDVPLTLACVLTPMNWFASILVNIILDTTEVSSWIPVWMTFTITQSHRARGKLEPVQSFCCNGHEVNQRCKTVDYEREMTAKKSCMVSMDHVSTCSTSCHLILSLIGDMKLLCAAGVPAQRRCGVCSGRSQTCSQWLHQCLGGGLWKCFQQHWGWDAGLVWSCLCFPKNLCERCVRSSYSAFSKNPKVSVTWKQRAGFTKNHVLVKVTFVTIRSGGVTFRNLWNNFRTESK